MGKWGETPRGGGAKMAESFATTNFAAFHVREKIMGVNLIAKFHLASRNSRTPKNIFKPPMLFPHD